MIKGKLREIVYKYKFSNLLWRNMIRLRDDHRYFYWKAYNKLYFNYVTKVRGHREVIFEKKLTNGMFKIFICKDKRNVIKFIRRDNPSSNKFYRRIKNRECYKQYSQVLTSIGNIDILGMHVTNATKILKNGGYVSPYKKGKI